MNILIPLILFVGCMGMAILSHDNRRHLWTIGFVILAIGWLHFSVKAIYE